MKHEKVQWKCFVPNTPSFCDHIRSRVELLSETFHMVHLKVPYYHALTLSSNGPCWVCILRQDVMPKHNMDLLSEGMKKVKLKGYKTVLKMYTYFLNL